MNQYCIQKHSNKTYYLDFNKKDMEGRTLTSSIPTRFNIIISFEKYGFEINGVQGYIIYYRQRHSYGNHICMYLLLKKMHVRPWSVSWQSQ